MKLKVEAVQRLRIFSFSRKSKIENRHIYMNVCMHLVHTYPDTSVPIV